MAPGKNLRKQADLLLPSRGYAGMAFRLELAMDLANPVSKYISSSEICASCNVLHVSEKNMSVKSYLHIDHTLDGSEIPKNHRKDVFETLFNRGYSLPTSTGA